MNEWYVNGDGVQLQNLVVIGYLQLGNQMLKWTKNFVDQYNFWILIGQWHMHIQGAEYLYMYKTCIYSHWQTSIINVQWM